MTDLIEYGTLTATRDLNVPPQLAFEAWTAPQHRRHWFAAAPFKDIERHTEVKVGGRDHVHGTFPNGKESRYDARFHVVEPGNRVVYDFDLYVDRVLYSISLTSVEFRAIEGGTRVTYVEQITYLGAHDAEGRAQGTEMVMENYATYAKGL